MYYFDKSILIAPKYIYTYMLNTHFMRMSKSLKRDHDLYVTLVLPTYYSELHNASYSELSLQYHPITCFLVNSNRSLQ